MDMIQCKRSIRHDPTTTTTYLKPYTIVINKETNRRNKSVFQQILLRDATRFLMKELYLNDETRQKSDYVYKHSKSNTIIYNVATKTMRHR